jgi:hypothetical protein
MAYGPGAVPAYHRSVTITNSDAVSIASGPTDAVCVAATGTFVLIDEAGNSSTYTLVPAGVILPVRAVRVNATGSTATLTALYYV